MDDNKAKALAAALQQIEKQFGKGSIMKMGDAEIDEAIQVVSTGSLGLDIALGVGGLPRGRVPRWQDSAGEVFVRTQPGYPIHRGEPAVCTESCPDRAIQARCDEEGACDAEGSP